VTHDDRREDDVTGLLIDWSNGNEQALSRLMPLVYDELRRSASVYLRRERSDHTLQTTALVHEAYLRLIDQRRVQWVSTVHFLALAARMMRRILLDHARSHRQTKRGGGAGKVSIDELGEPMAKQSAPEVLQMDEALTQLTDSDPELGKIVEMRYFGGMTSEQIAEVMESSIPTVTRRMRMAKAWLARYLTGGDPGEQ
jgi:RNA polymerase sigma factor (TIGR02999 family)